MLNNLTWIRKQVRNQRTDDLDFIIWHGPVGYKCTLYKCAKQVKTENGTKYYYQPIEVFQRIPDAKYFASYYKYCKRPFRWPNCYHYQKFLEEGVYSYLVVEYVTSGCMSGGEIWTFENLREEI